MTNRLSSSQVGAFSFPLTRHMSFLSPIVLDHGPRWRFRNKRLEVGGSSSGAVSPLRSGLAKASSSPFSAIGDTTGDSLAFRPNTL